MTLGEIIKQYRTENKVSMEYVAKQCGITKGYVAQNGYVNKGIIDYYIRV